MTTIQHCITLAYAIHGATRPPQLISWHDQEGTPFDLTGATLTGRIQNAGTLVARNVVGALVLVDAVNGVFRWDYDAADVAEPGDFLVQFTASFASPPTPAKTIVTSWQVKINLDA